MDLHLKPQDVVVGLKLVAQADAEWTQPELARCLKPSRPATSSTCASAA